MFLTKLSLVRFSRSLTVRVVLAFATFSPAYSARAEKPPRNKITLSFAKQIDPDMHKDLKVGVDCSNCHQQAHGSPLTKNRALEMAAVYYPHGEHTDRAECYDCHITGEPAPKVSLPLRENCLPCHDSSFLDAIKHNLDFIGARCTSCHAIKPGEQTPHQALYPKHKAQGIQCADCHAVSQKKIGSVADDKQILTPDQIKALDSAAGQKIALPVVTTCLACHAEKKKTIGRPNPPSFSMVFHAEKGVGCVSCHPNKTLEPPSTKICLPCHDKIDHKLSADNGLCLTCHVPAVELSPHPTDMRRADVHGLKANSPDAQCRDCHAPSQAAKALLGGPKACKDCHAAASPMPDNHLFPDGQPNPNFRYFAHQFELQKSIQECSSCHDKIIFCERCHGASGIIGHQLLKPDHDNKTSLWRQAREDAERCRNCHSDNDPNILWLIRQFRK